MTKLEYAPLTLRDGDMRYRSIEVNDKGELVFEQVDVGTNTARFAPNGGDTDYEYWITVNSDQTDRVLLELIRDKFSDQDEFKDWLIHCQIPYDFNSY